MALFNIAFYHEHIDLCVTISFFGYLEPNPWKYAFKNQINVMFKYCDTYNIRLVNKLQNNTNDTVRKNFLIKSILIYHQPVS